MVCFRYVIVIEVISNNNANNNNNNNKFASVITTDYQKTSVSLSPETSVSTYVRQLAVSIV